MARVWGDRHTTSRQDAVLAPHTHACYCRRPHGAPLSALLLLLAPHASATELVWDGFYRGRGLVYDSLSLSNSNANAEKSSASFDDRFTLRPAWLLSDHASLHAQVDVFPYTLWGDAPATTVDPVTGEETARAFTDGVATSGSGLQAVRAWGEVHADFGSKGQGRFAAGRMPMEWGSGILWNPGDDPEAEAGDSADRVQFSGNLGQVWMMAAWDVQFEGFLGQPDDMQSVNLALGYRNETNGAGLLNVYRYQPSNTWQQYTGDLWAFTQLGKLRAELEVVAEVGGGDLETGADGISQTAFGGMVTVDYRLDPLALSLEGGFATGDGDPEDKKIHTFTFDRDHNVALFMFEEPLPTLVTPVVNETNGGRTTEAALTGDGISNALYLRPSVRWAVRPQVTAQLDWTTAMLAKKPAASTSGNGYGNEFDLSVRYDPFAHFWVKGTAGLFLPGAWYRDYEDPDLGGGFDQPAFGGRVLGVVEF